MKKLLTLLPLSFLLFTANLFAQFSYQNVNSQTVSKELRHVATDNAGNIFISGGLNSTLTFGSYTVTNNYPNPCSSCGETPTSFIAREVPDGNGGYNFTWAKSIVLSTYKQGPNTYISSARITDLSADQGGNCYITGYFYGKVSLDAITLTNINTYGGNTIFTAKLSPSGNFLWAKMETPTIDIIGNAVSTDAFGNVYVTGHFSSKKITRPITKWLTDVYVVKYNTAGTKLWEKKYTSTSSGEFYHQGRSIETDGSSVYVTGSIAGQVDFGNGYTFNTSGAKNCFLLKLDVNGNTQWVKTVNGIMGLSLVIDNSNVYYEGSALNGTTLDFGNAISILSTGDRFLAKYSSAGNAIWAINADSIRGTAIAKKPLGGILAVSTSSGNYITVKEFSLTDGQVVSSTTSTGTSWACSNISDINATPDGYIFSLNLSGSLDFGGITISSTSNGMDMMVVKYTTAPPLRSAILRIDNEKNLLRLGIILYPNPAVNQITVQNNKNKMLCKLIIYDASGKMVYNNFIGSSRATIDIKKFSPGVYYLRSDQMEKAIKFEKQ